MDYTTHNYLIRFKELEPALLRVELYSRLHYGNFFVFPDNGLAGWAYHIERRAGSAYYGQIAVFRNGVKTYPNV